MSLRSRRSTRLAPRGIAALSDFAPSLVGPSKERFESGCRFFLREVRSPRVASEPCARRRT
jgi:hypothetical protein